MRYSIIHHDVREKFGLNLNQYVVADSIHQLSHRGPTTKPNTKIAEFLGLDETTVRRAKASLLEKGLIEEVDDGVRTTGTWYEAVTYARQKAEGSAKSRDTRENAESHYIHKEVKKDKEPEIAKAIPSPFKVLSDTKRPNTTTGKNKVVLALRAKLYAMFEKEYGSPSIPSMADYLRVTAALRYISEKDIITMVEDALQVGKKRTVREVLTDREIDIYRQNS